MRSRRRTLLVRESLKSARTHGKAMSKALQDVRIGRRTVWAHFDSGAGRSYIVRRAVPRSAPRGRDPRAFPVGLGGKERRLRDWCTLVAHVDGVSFSFKAYVLDEIGREGGREIELIVGAPVLEEWEIGLRPAGRRLVLDLSRLRQGEFVDYWSTQSGPRRASPRVRVAVPPPVRTRVRSPSIPQEGSSRTPGTGSAPC